MFLLTMLRTRKEAVQNLTHVESLTADLVNRIRDTADENPFTRQEQGDLTKEFWRLVHAIREEKR